MVINSNGGSELTRLVNNMTVCDKKDFAILLLAMIASLNFVITRVNVKTTDLDN